MDTNQIKSSLSDEWDDFDYDAEDETDDVVRENIQLHRLKLYPKQDEAIFYPRDINGDEARYSVIEAGTKTGKTVGCICWLFEVALHGPPGNYWWVAPVSRQAAIAFRRMKSFFNREVMTPLLTPVPTITLPGGQVIWFLSGEDPDNLYGEDVWAAVIDEASRLREEAWHAVRSTLTATRGPMRFIGNVKGRKNWFYGMARRAERGEPGYSYHKIVAADAVAAKVLAAEEIESAKRDLPEQVFKELYLAEASDDGGNPFGLQHIEKVLHPLSMAPPVAWGWDLAKKHDFTVGIGLDISGRVCRFHRWQLPWKETIKKIRAITMRIPAYVDSTGVGDPIVEHLQDDNPGHRIEEYLFTPQSKQKLMEGLAVAIQNEETSIIGPTIHGVKHVMQLEAESFEYVLTRTGVRYSAPEGFFDDCTCAHALAVAAKFNLPQALVISNSAIIASRRPGSRTARVFT